MKKVDIVGIDTSSLPKLSNAQTLEMLHRIRNHDLEARQQFIFANMRLVLSVIQKYIHAKNNYDDLFQVGCIGLIKAIDNFNPSFNVKFSTYAVPMIIGEIRRYLRDENGIHVSRSIRDTAYRALQTAEQMSKNLNREVTMEEVANALSESLSNVYFALAATGSVSSLDEPIGERSSDNTTLIEQISDNNTNSDDWLGYKAMHDAIDNLVQKEREILMMRYYDGKTQMEVSNEIGISQAQVSRLEKNALANIKNRL
ncbi:MAG: SigB/SigF/SigG family RNA polymerase sigma factor [Prevotella sp.]|nr:SigB/SigF/SigG family RNA polymerase sigma factor [Prevotella sp.]